MTMEEEYQMKLGYAERKGLEKGMEQGEERINRLNLRLREENRIEEIFRAAEDKAYREQLLEEFGL